jgi:hypothetical protein
MSRRRRGDYGGGAPPRAAGTRLKIPLTGEGDLPAAPVVRTKYNFVEPVPGFAYRDFVFSTKPATKVAYSYIDNSNNASNSDGTVQVMNGDNYYKWTDPPGTTPTSPTYPVVVDLSTYTNFSSEVLEHEEGRIKSEVNQHIFYDPIDGVWRILEVTPTKEMIDSPSSVVAPLFSEGEGTIVFKITPPGSATIPPVAGSSYADGGWVGPTDPSSPLGTYYFSVFPSLTAVLGEVV